MNKAWLLLALILGSCTDPEKVKYEQYLVNGEKLYDQHCSNCHGSQGEGLRNLYPGIKNAEIFQNIPEFICLIKNGRNAEHAKFESKQAMPSNRALYDLDIAQLSTYILNEFGSKEMLVGSEEVKSSLMECVID